MRGVHTVTADVQGSASIVVPVDTSQVWQLISDPTRTGDFSPENIGARWRHGVTQAAVGAHFFGFNRRGPLVWFTECVVVECQPNRVFSFEVGLPPILTNVARWTWLLEAVVDPLATDSEPIGTRVTLMWRLPEKLAPSRRLLWRGIGVSDRPANLTAGSATTLRAIAQFLDSE